MMKLSIASLVLITWSSSAVAQTFEPSPTDPRIVAAMEARHRMDSSGSNFSLLEQLFAPDLVVNSPINKVVSRANVMERFRSGQIAYEENATVNIEFAGVRGDSVVLMGEEVVTPTANAPFAGKLIRRRFTDIWAPVNGRWMLAIRQATITSVE